MTARPEVAVAETVNDVLTVRVPGLLNEIVWFDLGTEPRHDEETRVHDDPAVALRK